MVFERLDQIQPVAMIKGIIEVDFSRQVVARLNEFINNHVTKHITA